MYWNLKSLYWLVYCPARVRHRKRLKFCKIFWKRIRKATTPVGRSKGIPAKVRYAQHTQTIEELSTWVTSKTEHM